MIAQVASGLTAAADLVRRWNGTWERRFPPLIDACSLRV